MLGSNPARARVRLGDVPQYPAFARDFPITVEQVVLMGRLGLGRWFGGYSAADRTIARRAMGETEVEHLAGRHIQHLSGGQLQRVLVARALAAARYMDRPRRATAGRDSAAARGRRLLAPVLEDAPQPRAA